MADDVQQREVLDRDSFAQSVQRGRSHSAFDGREHLTGDRIQRGPHVLHRWRRVEGVEPVLVQAIRVGDQDQRAQVAPANRRKTLVGDTRQIQRERHSLVQTQKIPAAIQRRAQPLPSQGPQLRVLDEQQHVQAVAAFRHRLDQGIPHVVTEDSLA